MSTAEATCAAVGFVAATRPCAQLKRVRSNPLAKTRPQTKATTMAAPRRAREDPVGIRESHLLVKGKLFSNLSGAATSARDLSSATRDIRRTLLLAGARCCELAHAAPRC